LTSSSKETDKTDPQHRTGLISWCDCKDLGVFHMSDCHRIENRPW